MGRVQCRGATLYRLLLFESLEIITYSCLVACAAKKKDLFKDYLIFDHFSKSPSALNFYLEFPKAMR